MSFSIKSIRDKLKNGIPSNKLETGTRRLIYVPKIKKMDLKNLGAKWDKELKAFYFWDNDNKDHELLGYTPDNFVTLTLPNELDYEVRKEVEESIINGSDFVNVVDDKGDWQTKIRLIESNSEAIALLIDEGLVILPPESINE